MVAHSEERWREAKRKCRLNNDDIALAKRLGLNPRSLIKNIPNKNELWKAPVKEWLRSIDERRQEKAGQKKLRKAAAQSPPPGQPGGDPPPSPPPDDPDDSDDLPF
jgi:hypothetical protein